MIQGRQATSLTALIKLMPDEFTMKQIGFAVKRLEAHANFLDELPTALGETDLNSIRAKKIHRFTKNQY